MEGEGQDRAAEGAEGRAASGSWRTLDQKAAGLVGDKADLARRLEEAERQRLRDGAKIQELEATLARQKSTREQLKAVAYDVLHQATLLDQQQQCQRRGHERRRQVLGGLAALVILLAGTCLMFGAGGTPSRSTLKGQLGRPAPAHLSQPSAGQRFASAAFAGGLATLMDSPALHAAEANPSRPAAGAAPAGLGAASTAGQHIDLIAAQLVAAEALPAADIRPAEPNPLVVQTATAAPSTAAQSKQAPAATLAAAPPQPESMTPPAVAEQLLALLQPEPAAKGARAPSEDFNLSIAAVLPAPAVTPTAAVLTPPTHSPEPLPAGTEELPPSDSAVAAQLLLADALQPQQAPAAMQAILSTRTSSADPTAAAVPLLAGSSHSHLPDTEVRPSAGTHVAERATAEVLPPAESLQLAATLVQPAAVSTQSTAAVTPLPTDSSQALLAGDVACLAAAPLSEPPI